MASHTFIRRDPDPLWRRVGECAYVVAAALADMFASAIEDGAHRIYQRMSRRHR